LAGTTQIGHSVGHGDRRGAQVLAVQSDAGAVGYPSVEDRLPGLVEEEEMQCGQ